MSNLFIASDHAGFEVKSRLIEHYAGILTDLGTDSAESCDYPIYAQKLARNVLSNTKALGILICGSGIGMSIAANRYKGIRAALCCTEEMAELARRHNNANVIVFGARIMAYDCILRCIDSFLTTLFDKGRHARRVDLIEQI